MSCIRSLEGTVAEIRSDLLVDGVVVRTDRLSDNEDEVVREDGQGGQAGEERQTDLLPGAGKGSKNDGSRNSAAEILTSAITFSPTGKEWAAATTQGLQVTFSFLCPP